MLGTNVHRTNLYADCDCGGLITFRGHGPGACNKCRTVYQMYQQGDSVYIRPFRIGTNYAFDPKKHSKPKSHTRQQAHQSRAQLSWSMRRNIVMVLVCVAIAVTIVTNMGG